VIQVFFAFILSLAQSKGGKIGELVTQLIGTLQAINLSKADYDAFVGPWLQWANGVIDRDNAGTPPTKEELAAGLALAQAINDNIESLGSGGAGVPLPSPPSA
jgi:hypothetical protein